MNPSADVAHRYFIPPIASASSTDECVVCAEHIQIYATYKCTHSCCYICALRMKKAGQFACPICRRQSDHVELSFTKTPPKDKKNRLFDKSMGFYYNDQRIIDAVHLLDAYRCPHESCWNVLHFQFTTFEDLSTHLKSHHKKVFCDICLKGKKNFLLQQHHYPETEIDLHMKGNHPSDPNTFLGHILCSFCKTHLYDMDQFMHHMRQQHLSCELCSSINPNRYFKDRQRLYNHFRKDHFVCQHPQCDKADLITKTFASEIDLQAHCVREHGSRSMKKMPLHMESLGFSFKKAAPVSTIDTAFTNLSIEQRRSNILVFDFLTFQRELDLTKFNYTNVNADEAIGNTDWEAYGMPATDLPKLNREEDGPGFVSRYKKVVMSGTRSQGNMAKEQKVTPETPLQKIFQKETVQTEKKPSIKPPQTTPDHDEPSSFPSLRDAYTTPKRKNPRFPIKVQKKPSAWG